MGKLQFKRGTTEVPVLKPGEPFFNNQDKLFIGKNDGTGNKEIGSNETGPGNSTIVEYLEGEMPPTIDADYQIGNFIQGRKHLVTITAVGDETVAIIQAENFAEGFDTITLGVNALPTSANFGDILVCVGNMKWNTIPAPTTQSYLMHSGVEESLPFWQSIFE